MIEVERRPNDEILREMEKGKPTFLIGCSGWKNVCQPGGETLLHQCQKELELMGVPFTGTLVVDALCNKGMDEIALLRQFRQALGAEAWLAISCAVGVQALSAVAGRPVVSALRTLAGEGFQGVWGEEETCRLCGQCLLDLSGGLCPLYFCPKGLLNGPCQGAKQGFCEVDLKKPCGWELIYERLKKQGRLEMLKPFAQMKDHSKILPLIRLRSSLVSGMKRG